MQLPFSHYTEAYNEETDTQKNGRDEGDIFHLRIDKFRSQESGQGAYTEITQQASKMVIDKALSALRTCCHSQGAAHSDTVYAADNACCNDCKRYHNGKHITYLIYYVIREVQQE
ncbi:hypothetical protein S225a_14550 [Candidatus Brocadiaceae bacterium S225]|uniref:Uncharacterized protein n=1 Tax=Candidatus Scalindua brodae TaxID=237368 RepID=A0A0B0EFZ3_9BACT|nr:MAG: hypothetical protein SCABRO_03288 [Candidatus Scalindua brodae]TWU33565.1 hypothetical protein S225a_14550 [Candidatus Brocadiaceae bacterium S225]